MEETWKDYLIDITSEAQLKRMPALEDLKRKILIKVKSIPLSAGAEEEATHADGLEQHISSESGGARGESAAPPKPSKILQALSKLAVYTKGFHFNHFSQPGTASYVYDVPVVYLLP